MTASPRAVDLIQHYESCRLHAYQDSRGLWTIGWGNRYYQNGRMVYEGDVVTKDEADRLFHFTLDGKVKSVDKMTLGLDLTQDQFDALCDMAYNIGPSALKASTLMTLIRENPYDPAIEGQFKVWIRSGHKVVKGLVKRRQSDWILYSTGQLDYEA